ncbi:MAG: hypothetical protein OXF74_10370 [Rhodobacteraceae bacterium]|nr:hypothetical protein [Paracoccaceae bacterium]
MPFFRSTRRKFIQFPEVEPELARRAERVPYAQGSVAGYRPAAVENPGDAVHRPHRAGGFLARSCRSRLATTNRLVERRGWPEAERRLALKGTAPEIIRKNRS